MANELRVRVSLDGAAQTTAEAQRIQEALKRVNSEAAAGSRAAPGVRKISDEVGGLSAKIASMASIGSKLLIGSVTLGSVASLAGAFKDAALQADKLKNTYAFAFGSVAAGADNLAYVKSTANNLGTALLSTAEAYGKLSAAAVGTNLEGTKTRAIFEAVSKAGTVLGLSSAETGGALTAIQQIMSKGTVQAEELRGQLGERLPGAFQIAARAMGVTTSELGKMLEQGKVLADDFLPRFAAELERTFGASAERAANSFQAQLNRMDNAWESFKMALAAPTAGGRDAPGVIDGMAESLGNAAGNMDRLAKAGHGVIARFFYGIGSVEMDILAWMAGTRSGSGAGIARDDAWIQRKLNEVARLRAEAEKEPGILKDRFSASAKLKIAQQELDEAIAVRNSNPNNIQLRDKEGARAAAKKHLEDLSADRLKLYDAFNAEVATRDAKLKKTLELENFDKKWAGMAVENPAYFAEARAKLVANLDAAIAREAGKGPKGIDPDRLHDKRLRELQHQAAQEMHELQAAERQRKAQERAQAAMDRTVGNLEDTYQRQNAIYNEKQMTAPQRELAEALRKVEEAADAAREALSQKAATLEVDDVQALDAYRAAVERVNAAEAAQLDQVKSLQAEQERLNGLWETGAERALTKYMDTTKNVADEVEEAFTRGFQGMEAALMSFITTGKANFADLAKAIIADLARIELKALLFGKGAGGESSGGGVLSGLAGKLFGFLGGGSSGPLPGSLGAAGGLPLPSFASGAVFSGAPSLHRYVNTVQDRPTPFAFGSLHRFAQGGIFAEAGAEAVMPVSMSELGRDSQGRLGIRRGGGNAVNITVNVSGAGGNLGEVRRAAGQGAREALTALQRARRYG